MGIEVENYGFIKRTLIPRRNLGFIVYCWSAIWSGCSASHSRNIPAASDAEPSRDGAQQGDASVPTKDGGGDSANVYDSAVADSGCVHVGPPIMDVTLLDPCPLCKNARCVPPGVIAAEDAKLLATCEDGVRICVPDYYLETGGRLLLKTCVSLQGAEGRCVSLCVPEITAQKDRLPRDVCAQDELCAPCYDPVTGEDTRSCRIGCDPGPSQPALIFTGCCHGIGSCVPRSVVAKEFLDLLGADTCEDKDTLCAPKSFIDPLGFVPESCTAVGGGEGRCIPTCVPMIGEQADRLQQGSCPKYHLCAPCYDPVTGKATGACALSNDPGPQGPALVFPECCGGLSVCVSTGLVPESQRSALGKDSCSGDRLCVPKEMAEDPTGFVPPSCVSWDGAEARCLPACLPGVAHEAPRIAQDGCENGYLCAPCYDHVSREDSGACHLAADPGPDPDKQPVFFDDCCGGLSSCVTVDAIKVEDRDKFVIESCDAGHLCVPKGIGLDPLGFIPDSCLSWNGAEGRCLPACLPDVAAKADQLGTGTCVEPGCDCELDGYLCAPCYDPLTGEDTQACAITPADSPPPSEEKYTFSECCESSKGSGVYLSRCIPAELVPDGQESMLDSGECSEPDNLCVPKPLTTDPTGWVPDKCLSWNGAEGRCLPACLPDVADKAGQLNQGTCVEAGCDCESDGYLCVPCYDPLTGEDTKACSVTPADSPPPPEDKYVFSECCESSAGSEVYLSRCIPAGLVPDAQESMLDAGECTEPDNLCVPKPLTTEPTTWVPDKCLSWGGGEGRCLPACLPDIAAMAGQLNQGTCVEAGCDCESDGYLCAPCYDPLTGEDTGACRITAADRPNPDVEPYTFPHCCGVGASALGTCVPSAFVPADQLALLGQDSCGAGFLCAPTLIALGTYVPTTCTSWLGAEGRCLPACLPPVAARASQLQDPATDGCGTDTLCVPCFDPVTKDPTGACTIEGDAPSNPTPVTFPACCPTPPPNGPDHGTCVPARAAGAQASTLPIMNCETDTNDADDYVCAPNEKVHQPNTNFAACTTAFDGPDSCGALDIACAIARSVASGYIGGKSGACVPSCVLSEQSTQIQYYGTFTSDQLYAQSTCPAGYDCGPCSYPQGHPQAGQTTGLCY